MSKQNNGAETNYNMSKRVIWVAIAGAALFLADRISKYMALRFCLERVIMNQCVAFELVFNRGVSWSMLKSSSAFYFGLLTVLL